MAAPLLNRRDTMSEDTDAAVPTGPRRRPTATSNEPLSPTVQPLMRPRTGMDQTELGDVYSDIGEWRADR